MENQVHLHEFRLKLTRGQTAACLSLIFICALAAKTSTESVTLTTYYPAPAGVYNNMVTIGNTWLARDNQTGTNTPSFVEIGANTPTPSAGTKLAVMNGNVGIGTTSPGSALDVAGTAQLRGMPGGAGLYVNSGGSVGIGTNNPQSQLDVEGGGCFTSCSFWGCYTSCPPTLRINNNGNGAQPGSVWTATDSQGDGSWQSIPLDVPWIYYVSSGNSETNGAYHLCSVSYVFDVAPAGSGGDGQGCKVTIVPGSGYVTWMGNWVAYWTLTANKANCGMVCE